MFRNLCVLTILGAFLAQSSARAQEKLDAEAINKKRTFELLEKAREEYRIFFKRPETAIEFWSAIKFEMDLGKFDLAALHLKLLLEKDAKEVDPDLVRLEAVEGVSAFLRLRQVRQWSDHPPFQKEAEASVESLLDRLTKAVETHLSDPVRIRKFINQLGAKTPEERAYAYVQLARSRERAAPYLIEALRVNYGKPLFRAVRETMLRIGPETVPVYLEVFKAANDKDYRDIELRLTLLDIVRERDDKRVIPYLWHMHASKKYPDAVRTRAKETLASLLRIEMNDIPPAKETLAYLAERYYQHKVPFPEGKAIEIWEWDGEGVRTSSDKLTPYNAEKFFGERYAREALDLDPGYQPAQVVLLNFTLERYYRPEVDQILMKPMPPKMQQLLTTIDADLVLRVLERGMDDRQVPVILPLVLALGERGEIRAVRTNDAGQPRGLARALYYPDRRVQFAAMVGMLRMPAGALSPATSDRVVDLSRRFLASQPTPRALIMHAPPGQEQPARQAVKDLGYDSLTAKSAVDAVNKGRLSADFDLVVLHRGMADADFAFSYSKLLREYDLSGLPILVVVENAREKAVKKLTAKDPNVVVLTEAKFQDAEVLKATLEALHRNAQIVKLTPDERKIFSRASLDFLWRMARGEIKGYNVMPALDAVTEQLGSPEKAVFAVEILGRLPGKEIQYKLAGIVTEPMRDKLRIPATLELNRHIQTNGLQLDQKQRADLKSAHQEAEEGSVLRAQLNVTMSLIARPALSRTGADLFKFRPDAPVPPPAPKEEKKDN